MHSTTFLGPWDTAIVMAPLFGLLACWMFGLDERVTAPRTRPARRHFCRPDWDERPRCSDPDGTPWHLEHRPKSETGTRGETVEILPLEMQDGDPVLN